MKLSRHCVRVFKSLLILAAISTHGIQAQQWCGSQTDELSALERSALLESMLRKPPQLPPGGALDSIAVTVHVVSSTAGSNPISPSLIEENLVSTNSIFSNAGLYLFLCGSPRYVLGEPEYSINSGELLNQQHHVPNTVNIYIVEDVQISISQGLCGFARFPYWLPPEQRFVVLNSQCWDSGSLLMHELGHYFGLFHTHETFSGVEFVDGTNCEEAGDLLCDTPADPNLSLPNMMAGCTYVGQVTDPRGDPYTPPVSNIMSYAPPACTRFFTEGQYDVIRSVRENKHAALIGSCDQYPDFGIEASVAEVVIQSDQDLSIEYTFTLEGIDQTYETELRIILSDDPDGSGPLLHEEFLSLEPGQQTFTRVLDLDFPIETSSGTYYLRAALDPAYEIVERTERNNVALTTVIVDNSGLNDVVLYPNPVYGDELRLFIRDDATSGRLDVRIFQYDGSLVWQGSRFKNNDRVEYFEIFDVAGLNPGLYLMTVDFERFNKNYAFKFFKL